MRACSVAQSCLTLCSPVDCSPPGFSVRGIFQARILEWVAISYSRGFSDPGIEPKCRVSPALAGGLFTTSAIWGAIFHYIYTFIYLDRREAACNAGDPGLMPGKGMATHSSILFWRIPWTEEPWTQGQWDTVDWVAESDMTERLCMYLYIYTHTTFSLSIHP